MELSRNQLLQYLLLRHGEKETSIQEWMKEHADVVAGTKTLLKHESEKILEEWDTCGDFQAKAENEGISYMYNQYGDYTWMSFDHFETLTCEACWCGKCWVAAAEDLADSIRKAYVRSEECLKEYSPDEDEDDDDYDDYEPEWLPSMKRTHTALQRAVELVDNQVVWRRAIVKLDPTWTSELHKVLETVNNERKAFSRSMWAIHWNILPTSVLDTTNRWNLAGDLVANSIFVTTTTVGLYIAKWLATQSMNVHSWPINDARGYLYTKRGRDVIAKRGIKRINKAIEALEVIATQDDADDDVSMGSVTIVDDNDGNVEMT